MERAASLRTYSSVHQSCHAKPPRGISSSLAEGKESDEIPPSSMLGDMIAVGRLEHAKETPDGVSLRP